MSQESQPRASISSMDMGRKGAGVNRFAQKGLYEKMSFGSSEGVDSGFLEGDGTTPPLHDSADKVNGDYRETPEDRFLEGKPTELSGAAWLPSGGSRARDLHLP